MMNTTSKAIRLGGLATWTIGAMLVAGAAQAQEATSTPPQAAQADNVGLQEIVVTAQRREESLQKVPISVTAADARVLQRNGITNVSQLESIAPNLDIRKSSATVNIFIRGAGNTDFGSGSTGSVSVYQDGVVINAGPAQLFSLYDMDRVEVLRGPQGTLFGRNTTGGAIQAFSKLPKPGQTDGYFQVGYGNANHIQAEGGASFDIAGDTLVGRIAAFSDTDDGYRYNIARGERYGKTDKQGARLILRYTPSADWDAILNLSVGRDHSDPEVGKQGGLNPTTGQQGPSANGYSEPNPNDFRNLNFDGNSWARNSFVGASLTVSHTMGNVSLKSITGFYHTDASDVLDADESPVAMNTNAYRTRANQYSEEITASYTGDRLKVVGGVFGFIENLRLANFYDAFRGCAGGGDPRLNTYYSLSYACQIGYLPVRIDGTKKTTNVAAFGQASYKLTDTLTATLGARYSYEKLDVGHNSFLDFGVAASQSPNDVHIPLQGSVLANPATVFPLLPQLNTSKHWGSPTWRAALDWQVQPNTLLYASYTRGFRAGGFSFNEFSNPTARTFYDPEKADAYETGIKANFFNHRLTTNLSGYYTKYKNLQVSSIRNTGGLLPVLTTNNAASAEIYGFEFEGRVLPFRSLELGTSIAYLHSEYTDYPDCRMGVSCTGNALPSSPRWSVNVDAQYTAELSQDYKLIFAPQFSYRSKRYFDEQNGKFVQQTPVRNGAGEITGYTSTGVVLQTPLASDPSYSLVNLRIALRNEAAGWELAAWGRNIFNVNYLKNSIDVTSPYGIYRRLLGEPRTYGVQFRLKF